MKNTLIKAGIPLLILLVAIGVASAMIMSKEPPEQQPVEDKAFLVDATAVSSQPVTFKVRSQGNVVPKNQTSLSAQVSGKVESLSEQFVVGGMVRKGDVLATLEQQDYLTDVKLAEAELAQAKAALQEEIARGKVAESEWKSVNSVVPPELGLRKPQLAREQANVKAAEAKLERAQRNLSRTRITAPYDGLVVSRNIDLGQFVSTGMAIGSVYATDVAEVRLPVTDSDLAFLDLQQSKRQQGNVTLTASVAGKTHTWTGSLVRTEGIRDSASRVVYVIVEVVDPYLRDSDEEGVALQFGQFVEASITGTRTEDLIVLPRTTLRLDNTVLVVEEGRELAIKPVDVLRTSADSVYLSDGLDDGDLVIMSAVPNPYNGMKVRLPGDEPVLPPEAENDKAEDTERVEQEASE
ncbi:efflux RND transporter periplasmic adaptor subunit [Alteromonas sp. ASW11-19]|uniref:Efflux RND transporter periplasmic adaptor subunit n=1 Tax=Alteromonas salexigens TaxID=2982530 RepID=A0ABT2VQ24_9ALTE|nr:efflux RND transporter periplasmic adaptor subunit [Alteromonas salexigens]MCU7554009.1 efflux RND transporter periplasmic adaptor subunit [Alteromonas salexigens]